MGFSKDIKLEILSTVKDFSDAEKKSFLSGVIQTSAEFNVNDNIYSFSIKTQVKDFCDVLKDICKNLYQLDLNVQEIEEKLFKNKRFEIIFCGEKINKVLQDLKIVNLNENNLVLNESFNIAPNMDSQFVKAFVKGSFVACGSASGIDKNEEKSVDYHIEWVLNSHLKAINLLNLLSQIGVLGRIVKRKKFFVVYLQKFEAISDMLVLFDATENMLKLNNEFAKRNLKNIVNRQSNCDTANMIKTVETSLFQLKAIELIKNTIGFERLDDDLVDVCMLRLANVEESLQELSNLSGMSKSAINYRLNKIMKIAKEIEEEQK